MNVLRETKPYELQYIEILKYIVEKGIKDLNQRTNVETYRIPHAVITVDLNDEFPILKCKNVYWKTAAKEILWIMQQQSNNIRDLDAKIWDAWADENGTIGKAYGYQIAKPVVVGDTIYNSQVEYILTKLATDPSDRRGVIDLWNVDDLNEMRLMPCCYSSVWNVIDGKLNCMLVQRSADFLVGVPFNTTQYAILTHLFARHLGLDVGQLTHVMADCHIYCYNSHLEGANKMISNYRNYDILNELETHHIDSIMNSNIDDMKHAVDVMNSVPTLKFNTTETDFFAITADDIDIEDYKYMESIKFDVAV